MATLFILRGAPGAGKTTYAKRLMEMGLAEKHFEADMWFERGGKYNFDAQRLAEAHMWCFEETICNLAAGYDVVVANCFMKRKQVETYVNWAKEHGHIAEVITLTGRFQNVHGVPQQKVDHIRKNLDAWEETTRRTAKV